MRSIIQKDDYVGFTYAGKHSSQFGLKSVTNGGRYTRNLSPEFQDLVSNFVGSDQTFYFGTNYTRRTINFNIAFDDVTEKEYSDIKKWLNSGINELIFDEIPYIKYYAKIANVSQINFLVFESEVLSTRIYKGELGLQFVCYEPFGHIVNKYINDYSGTGFDNKNEYGINNIADNIFEWADDSGLQYGQNVSFGTQYIEFDKELTSTEGYKYINVYNPGDLPVNFKITIENPETSILSIDLFDQTTDTPLESLVYNLDKIQWPSSSSERTIVIDGAKHLATASDGDQTISINYARQSGLFFKIPQCNSREQWYRIMVRDGAGSPVNANLQIDYEYLYL